MYVTYDRFSIAHYEPDAPFATCSYEHLCVQDTIYIFLVLHKLFTVFLIHWNKSIFY